MDKVGHQRERIPGRALPGTRSSQGNSNGNSNSVVHGSGLLRVWRGGRAGRTRRKPVHGGSMAPSMAPTVLPALRPAFDSFPVTDARGVASSARLPFPEAVGGTETRRGRIRFPAENGYDLTECAQRTTRTIFFFFSVAGRTRKLSEVGRGGFAGCPRHGCRGQARDGSRRPRDHPARPSAAFCFWLQRPTHSHEGLRRWLEIQYRLIPGTVQPQSAHAPTPHSPSRPAPGRLLDRRPMWRHSAGLRAQIHRLARERLRLRPLALQRASSARSCSTAGSPATISSAWSRLLAARPGRSPGVVPVRLPQIFHLRITQRLSDNSLSSGPAAASTAARRAARRGGIDRLDHRWCAAHAGGQGQAEAGQGQGCIRDRMFIGIIGSGRSGGGRCRGRFGRRFRLAVQAEPAAPATALAVGLALPLRRRGRRARA